MRTIFCFLTLFVLCVSHSTAQIGADVSPAEQSSDVPRHSSRPKLAMQDALVIAEKYLSTEPIDSSQYWLYRANWILYGGSATAAKDKIPGWHFLWNSDFGTTANSIELFVSMDGKCMRLPTM